MSEATMWRALRPKLVPYGLVERIENAVSAGMADVNYCFSSKEGWIELKEVEEWPPNGGALRIPHFTRRQRTWHRVRARAGSVTWVLLHVRRTNDWLLFHGDIAADHLGLEGRDDLRAVCTTWTTGITGRHLVGTLLSD